MRYSCHPSIEKWLSQTGVQCFEGRCFISAYHAQAGQAHSGILQAVKHRLANPNQCPIIFFSFHSQKALTQQDTYGILSLTGTAFVQLPVSKETLLNVINKHNAAFSIPAAEWERFSLPAYTQLIKETISKLTHGNPNALGNGAINPLRLACATYLSFPDSLPLVTDSLRQLRQYIQVGEMAEFISLAANAPTGNVPFLLTAANFTKQVNELAAAGCQSVEEAQKLIFIIDNLNDTWNKLIIN